MNRLITALMVCAAGSSVAVETNYLNVGSPDPDFLVNTTYIATPGSAAATLQNIGAATVSGSEIQGGDQGSLSASDDATRIGGHGLVLDAVGNTTINSSSGVATIEGGVGGTIDLTDNVANVRVNGGYGIVANGSSSVLTIDSGEIMGGDAGAIAGPSIVSTANEAVGGSALYADGTQLDVSGGTFVGGDGGKVSLKVMLDTTANGGAGVEVGPALIAGQAISGGEFQGGTGGNVVADEGKARAWGGDGYLSAYDYLSSAYDLTIDDGTFSGGNGGVATYGTATAHTLFDDEAQNTFGARGGNGLRIAEATLFANSAVSVTVNGGTFTGGDGGQALNKLSGGVAATGGHGLFLGGVTAVINDGYFEGGMGGLANGDADKDGFGAFFLDAESLTINGGTFAGDQGLRIGALYYTINSLITGGTFSDVEISAVNGGGGYSGLNNLTISNGSFGKMLFRGDTVNNATIAGGSFESFEIMESAATTIDMTGGSVGSVMVNASGANTVNLGNSGVSDLSFMGGGDNQALITDNGAAIQMISVSGAGTELDLAFNANHTVNNISVDNAVLGISGSDLSIGSGGKYETLGANSEFVTDSDLTVMAGGMFTAQNVAEVDGKFTAKAGATINTYYSNNGGAPVANVLKTGDLDLETGLRWNILNDDTYSSPDSTAKELMVASWTGSVTQNLVATDFNLVDYPVWYMGVTGVTEKVTGLYVNVDRLPLNEALTGDEDFLNAMEDLQSLLTPEMLAAFESFTFEQAQRDLYNEYVRTTESASTLINVQGVIADQVKARTRGNLRFNNFGAAASSRPAGSYGPSDWYDNTVDWTREHLPTWDARSDQRKISDAAPMVDLERIADKAPEISADGATLPATYQIWGSGYGSRIDQGATSGNVGYDATIVGGVLGLDKRYGRALAGIGGGFARTKLNGNAGNNGDINTGHVMGYFSTSGEKFYVDAFLNYAFNGVDTEGLSSLSYSANYNAHTVGFNIGTGYAFSFASDAIVLTPEVALIGAYYTRDGYTETSPIFPDKAYDSYDQFVPMTSLGATLVSRKRYNNYRNEMEIQPELRVHWLHDFNAEMDDETYTMVGGQNQIGVALQAREEDLIKFGAGLNFNTLEHENTEFGVDVDGVFGKDYTSYILTGRVTHRF